MYHRDLRQRTIIIIGIVLFIMLFWRFIPILLLILAFYALQRRAEGQDPFPPSLRKYISFMNLSSMFHKKKTTAHTVGGKHRSGRRLLMFIGIAILVIILVNSITVIGAGQTGVQTLFGKVNDREFSSGIHLKNPFVRITEMSIRTEEYTMSISHGEGKRVGDDSIAALTKEGLKVDLDITVLYRLSEGKASDVYRYVGLSYEEKIIRPQIRSTIRGVVSQYSAKEIYAEKRSVASTEILERLESALRVRGIEVEDVLLRNVALPTDLAESIELKLQAEQEAERYDFILEKEKKEAERKRVEAEGQRDAQQIINQSLTPRYLEYLYINSLKDREGTIYVPTNPNNGTPLFRGI